MKINKDKPGTKERVLVWVTVLVITLIVFYGMNHLVMGMQGLPLNWDLTPAQ